MKKIFLLFPFLLTLAPGPEWVIVDDTTLNKLGDDKYYELLGAGERVYYKIKGNGRPDGTGLVWKNAGKLKVIRLSFQARDMSTGQISGPPIVKVVADTVQEFAVPLSQWTSFDMDVGLVPDSVMFLFANDEWEQGVKDRNVAIDSIKLYVISNVQADTLKGRAIKFSWDANNEPDLKSYALWAGDQPGLYDWKKEVTDTTATIESPYNRVRFYSLTAEDTTGNVSDYSNELPILLLPPDTLWIADTTAPEPPKKFVFTAVDSVVVYVRK